MAPGTFQRKFLITAWSFAVAAGFWLLLVYSHTPGEPARAPLVWPAASRIARTSGVPSLLVFAHPECACSNATIGELARLAPRLHNRIPMSVLFVKPSLEAKEASREPLWQTAHAIPGVRVYADEGSLEAERFGAKVSGQVMLYDGDGKLVFSGGITPSRGHMGDSLGRAAILAFAESGATGTSSAAVFGCALQNPERARE